MATLNLGRIKPVFRGAWTSGAYVIDDIVTHGNESFICIQAGSNIATSNASYWTKLAAKGADGTDLTSTLTTQGDILYRDGSGLQRLAKGTAAQSLVMNAGATAPEWASASSEAGKFPFHAYQNSNSSAVPQSSNTEWVVPAEHYDPNSKFDTSTGRYTPGETGVYYFSGGITMNDINGAADMLYVKFRVNGASSPEWGHVRQGGASGSAFRNVNTTAVIPLTNANDYVSMWFYQTAGGNRLIQGDMSHFAGFKIA